MARALYQRGSRFLRIRAKNPRAPDAASRGCSPPPSPSSPIRCPTSATLGIKPPKRNCSIDRGIDRRAERVIRAPAMRAHKTVGVIGGSGLYDIAGLSDVREVQVDTPFGSPSDAYIVGELDGVRMVFLPRHGRGHRFLPSEVNYAANIFGMKRLGVEFIVSVSAVGSLRENIRPGDVVLPEQFIDRTRGRRSSFFGQGLVGHVSFADPVCRRVHSCLVRAAAQHVPAESLHRGGTHVVMEGPAFSTRAESHLYRSWGADIIGMTNLPEAKLAREAEICYATLALPTDYDCWKQDEEAVSVDAVIAVLQRNVSRARDIVRTVAGLLADLPPHDEHACPCPNAARHAVMTAPDRIPADLRERLAPLFGRYLGSAG